MISVVHLVAIVMGMMVVVKIIMVFYIRMPMPHIIMMRCSIRMGTW